MRRRPQFDPMLAHLTLERSKGPEAEADALNSLNRKGRRKLVSLLRKGTRHAR